MASPLGLSFTTDKNDKRIPQYSVTDSKAVKSLFNAGQFSPYPTVKDPSSGSVTGVKSAFDIHNDDVNDISIGSIIEYCSNAERPAMKLSYAQFAYLKKLGVYPNNRLIIARRFAGGVANDLNEVKGEPLATLISWFAEDEEPLTIKFNEEWEGSEGGFEDVLNDIGEDVLMGDNKGGKLGGAAKGHFGIIPLPGLMEGVQLEMLNLLGLAGSNQGAGMSPFGNPNLIREALVRKVVKKATAGSGLSCDIGIKMTIEYEQKFINGVDPTLVYLDILQNALTFGTSESVFQYSSAFGSGANDIIKKLISGDIQGIIQAITQMVTALINALKTAITKIADSLKKAIDEKETKKDQSPEDKANEEKSFIDQAAKALTDNLDYVLKISLGTVISKYKVRLQGIIHALTGQPSTPWHITIGNPKKPIFSSGDMLCSDVTVTLGKVLAFNDLPSSITIVCNFKNARGLGSQEIFNRFNSGRGRSYTRINKSFVEVSDYQVNEIVKQEIDKENAAKNPETQKTPKEENKPATAATTTPVDKDKDKGTKQSEIPPPKDDYPVDFSKQGVPWGPKQLEPPPPPTTASDYTAKFLASLDASLNPNPNAASTKTSNQSVSDPNIKPEIKPAEGTGNPAPNSTTPGVTQSGSEVQAQVNAGNTEAVPPPPITIPEPDPPVREPELEFDENGNLVFSNADGSEKLRNEERSLVNQAATASISNITTTGNIQNVSKEQLEARTKAIESQLTELESVIAKNAAAGTVEEAAEKNKELLALFESLFKEHSSIKFELKNRG